MTRIKPILLGVLLAASIQSPANAWVLSLFPPTQYPPQTAEPVTDAITSADTDVSE